MFVSSCEFPALTFIERWFSTASSISKFKHQFKRHTSLFNADLCHKVMHGFSGPAGGTLVGLKLQIFHMEFGVWGWANMVTCVCSRKKWKKQKNTCVVRNIFYFVEVLHTRTLGYLTRLQRNNQQKHTSTTVYRPKKWRRLLRCFMINNGNVMEITTDPTETATRHLHTLYSVYKTIYTKNRANIYRTDYLQDQKRTQRWRAIFIYIYIFICCIYLFVLDSFTYRVCGQIENHELAMCSSCSLNCCEWCESSVTLSTISWMAAVLG